MSELTLVIGNKAYSSWSLRPWLAMKQAELTFGEIVIPLRQPDSAERIRAYSPTGRLPCLHHGNRRIWDSLAICEYVTELTPAAGLWPDDARARAAARSVSAEMHSGFAALRSAMPMDLKNQRPGEGRTPECDADIARITAMWSEMRTQFGEEGPFLFGRFTVADAMFAPVVTRFQTYDVAVGDELRAYMDTILALPAMRDWYAAARAEEWVIAH